MTSKTNINNGYTCLAVTIISLPLFTDLLQFIAFRDGKILIQHFVHFISVFNHLCLKDCHPPELHWCWYESRLVKLLVFCLLGRKFGQSFFVCVSFIPFYKQAKSVSQQMRNCVCKTQTATTGTRPPLVASQYTMSVLIPRQTLYQRRRDSIMLHRLCNDVSTWCA